MNDILSSYESSNEVSESVYSDKSNSKLTEVSQDCEIVEFQQNCDGSESHNEESRLQNTPSTLAVPLLNVRKTPRQSDLTRKRKVAVNDVHKGKRPMKERYSKATVNVKPDQRVKEYPHEHFTVSNGKLFCEACRAGTNVVEEK